MTTSRKQDTDEIAKLAATIADQETKIASLLVANEKLKRLNAHLYEAVQADAPLVGGSGEQVGGTVINEAAERKLYRLTRKQCAVVLASVAGVAPTVQARLLEISYSTVKNHFRAACKHLGVTNRTELQAVFGEIINGLEDKDFERRFKVSKYWHEYPDAVPPELLEKSSLLANKPRATKKKGATRK